MRKLPIILLVFTFIGCTNPNPPKVEDQKKPPIVLPSHKILSSTKLISGGYAKDILVLEPSFFKTSSGAEIDSIVRLFSKELYSSQIALFATEEAQKASYSDSYSQQNPHAIDGFICSFDQGKFNYGPYLKGEIKR